MSVSLRLKGTGIDQLMLTKLDCDVQVHGYLKFGTSKPYEILEIVYVTYCRSYNGDVGKAMWSGFISGCKKIMYRRWHKVRGIWDGMDSAKRIG